MCQELTQGGSERQLTETARGLDPARFTAHVGCLRPNGIRFEELRAAGIPLAIFPLPSFGNPAALLRSAARMGRYLRENNIQLVHTFDTPGNIFGVPVARAYRTPVVLSSQRAFRGLVGPGYRKALRLTDKLVDGVVVNCRQLEHHLYADEGVPRGRIRLCYNGIDTSQFHPQPPRRMEALREATPGARAESTLVIGVVCALRPEKGLPTLMEAFARIRAERPGVRLAIIGSGPVLPALETLRAELHLGESCLFVPSTRDVVPWLRSIDIFVLPSLSEAFSNSLMEAMACGCAAIASRVGGNPELVSEGVTGLLFTPSDAGSLQQALRTLIDKPETRTAFAAAGAEMIRTRFSREAAAAAMSTIYDSYLGKPPGVNEI